MSKRAHHIDACEKPADTLLQQKQAADAAERQWQITFDAIPDPIALIDTHHRITRVNRSMAKLLQRSAEEITGRHCYELVHGAATPPPFCPHARMLESGNTEQSEIVEDRLGGVFEVTATPFTDPEGQIAGCVHMIRDITERVRDEEEKRFRLRFLEALTRLSSRFVGVGTDAEFDEVIDDTLRRLGELFDVDRSYIFRFSAGLDDMTNTHEWCAEGVFPQKERIQEIPTDSLPWWKERIMKMQPVHIPDVSALPPEAQSEREEFLSQNIRSLICLPIVSIRGWLAGFLGFDVVRRSYNWSGDRIAMLEVAAELIGNAVERRNAANALEQALEERRILLDNIHTQVWYLIDEKTYGAVNRAHADFVGAAPKDIAFKPMHDIFPREVVEINLKNNAAVFSSGTPFLSEEWMPDGKGEHRLLSIHRAPKLRFDGAVEYVVCSAEDITLQHQANQEREATLTAMRAITDSANDAVIMMNPEGNISFWNPAAEKMFGYHNDEVMGKNVHKLLAPAHYHKAYETAFPRFQKMGRGNAIGRTLELEALKKDGSQIFIELSLSSLKRPDGWHAVGIVRNITERKRSEAELTLLATTDDLTGIWNRRYFLDAMAREIERARRHGHVFSVLMLDIDHFKTINDKFGHASGDAVLKHLVTVKQGILRQTDITGRLGGEEFGILLPETNLDGAVLLAERLRSTIEETPAHHDGRDIFYTVSIGAADYRQDEDSIDKLLLQADKALYRAKEAGRNRVSAAP